MKFKKQVKYIIIVFFVIIIIGFIVSISYFKNKPKKIDYSNDIVVKFNNSDIIELENKLPISDVLGKNLTGEGTSKGIQGYVEFLVINNLSKKVPFEIYLTKQNVYEKEIKDNYIKLYLTDFNDVAYEGFDTNIIPTFNKLKFLPDLVSSRSLYSSSLKANETKKFKLRVWLSDTYVISKNTEYFGFDVDVKTK